MDEKLKSRKKIATKIGKTISPNPNPFSNAAEPLKSEKIAPVPDVNSEFDIPEPLLALNQTIFENSHRIFNQQLNYWQDSVSLFQQLSTKWLKEPFQVVQNKNELKETDKRFRHESWSAQPFFEFVKEYYLLNSQHFKDLIKDMAENIEDEKIKHQMNFMVQQWIDAIAPSNFLLTNPEAYELAIQTQGQSLLTGMRHFIEDFEHDSGFIKTKLSDTSAFEVGKNLAITPGKVVFQNDLMQLILYAPQTENVFQKPLLMIPPWINKFYILDMQAHNSLVNFMVQQGFTVFLISWVNPDKAHELKELSDYLMEGPLKAIEFIQQKMGNIPIDTMGYCIGGTLQACLLSYLASKDKDCIGTATFLATLLDFSDPGDMGVYIDERQLEKLNQHMLKKGYLEGSVMAATFNSLRANDLIWNYFVKNYLKGEKPPAFDLLYWNSDNTNMPAKVHSTYLKDMYLHNLLIKPNQLKLASTTIDLSQIKIPSYFVATKEDHIAPWTACYKSMMALAGEKKFILCGSGHVAGIINPPAKNKYGYQLNKKLIAVPEKWLEQTQSFGGSWWTDWVEWLKKSNSQQVKASQIHSLFKEFIEKAPGSYVLKKSTDPIPNQFQNYFLEKMKFIFTQQSTQMFKATDLKTS